MIFQFYRRFLKTTDPASSATNSKFKGWVVLLSILVMLFFVVFWIAPSVAELTGHSQLKKIADDGIKITGIYYTDLDVYSEAQRSIGDKLTFVIHPKAPETVTQP